MRAWRLAILGSGTLWVACSSTGVDPNVTATCLGGYLTLAGAVDEQKVAFMSRDRSGQFQQGTLPYTQDFQFPGGQVHLEWTAAFPTGAPPTPATGTIVLPPGSPHAGETLCGAQATIRQGLPGRSGVEDTIFTLDSLSSGPACPGSAVEGAISGCWSF